MHDEDYAVSISDQLGDELTGMRASPSGFIVTGTAQPEPNFENLEAEFNVEISYERAPNSAQELNETYERFKALSRSDSQSFSVRTAYVDTACGFVVVIVGDDIAAEKLTTAAKEGGFSEQLEVVAKPGYLVTHRGPPSLD